MGQLQRLDPGEADIFTSSPERREPLAGSAYLIPSLMNGPHRPRPHTEVREQLTRSQVFRRKHVCLSASTASAMDIQKAPGSPVMGAVPQDQQGICQTTGQTEQVYRGACGEETGHRRTRQRGVPVTGTRTDMQDRHADREQNLP